MENTEPRTSSQIDRFILKVKEINSWIENKTLFQLFFLVITSLAFIIGFSADFLALYTKWGVDFLHTLTSISYVFILVFAIYHIYLSKKRLTDLVYTRLQLKYSNKLIRRAAEISPTDYKVLESEIVLDIQQNGDVFYKRTMRLTGVRTHIPWAIFSVGTIDGETLIPQQMNLKITDSVRNADLAFTLIEDNPSRKKIAILLDPPAHKTQSASFCATCYLPKAYIELIKKNPDYGRVSIDNITERFRLVIYGPKNIKLSDFMWTNQPPGVQTKYEQEDGRTVLEWNGINLPIGKYLYHICGN
jgi:hypothetical protein